MTANEGAAEALLPTIWRQRWVVVLTTAACLILCLAYLFVATPVYSITARLYVHKAAPPEFESTGKHGEGSRWR